jgi:hypothetical protein
MNPLAVKVIVVALALIVSFTAGWRVKGAFVAEGELEAQQARVEMISLIRAEEGRVAQVVEDRLAKLRANERIIERDKIQVIKDPVYLNECLSSDGLRLIERARTGGTSPAESTGEVSRTE